MSNDNNRNQILNCIKYKLEIEKKYTYHRLEISE